MSGTALKLIALFFMLIDHIGQFIPGMPIILRWLGRISAPLFLFCTMHGFSHTRNRRKYLLRLYLFGLVTAVAELICSLLCPYPGLEFNDNIFVTLFCVCITVLMAEQAADRRSIVLLFFVWQLAAAFICLLCDGTALHGVVTALSASAFVCEGGIFFVSMGLCMYFVRNDRKKLSLVYLLFSLVQFAAALLTGSLLENFQWMMLFALPFMLAYNEKRGAGLKYLFYIIYPAHLVLLYLIGAGMQ